MNRLLFSMQDLALIPQFMPGSFFWTTDEVIQVARDSGYDGVVFFPFNKRVSLPKDEGNLAFLSIIAQSYRSEKSLWDVLRHPHKLPALISWLTLPERVDSVEIMRSFAEVSENQKFLFFPPHYRYEGKIGHKVWDDDDYIDEFIVDYPHFQVLLAPEAGLTFRWNLGIMVRADQFISEAMERGFQGGVIDPAYLTRPPSQGIDSKFGFADLNEDQTIAWLNFAEAFNLRIERFLKIDKFTRMIDQMWWNGDIIVRPSAKLVHQYAGGGIMTITKLTKAHKRIREEAFNILS